MAQCAFVLALACICGLGGCSRIVAVVGHPSVADTRTPDDIQDGSTVIDIDANLVQLDGAAASTAESMDSIVPHLDVPDVEIGQLDIPSGCSASECDDGNSCTEDVCIGVNACVHIAVAGGCDDGNTCTINDNCGKGACLPGPATNCDDGNACTTDACESTIGCAHEAATVGCSDGNLCTSGDACAEISCVPGPAAPCDDSNECTADSCDPKTGCIFLANSITCADDGNVCTQDVCLAGSCTHTANDGVPCNDGIACTENDVCSGGLCQGSPLVWTADWIQSATGALLGPSEIAADLAGDGWLIKTQTEPGNTRLLRVDHTSKELWDKKLLDDAVEVSARQGGWAINSCNNCASEHITILNSTGDWVATYNTPTGEFFGDLSWQDSNVVLARTFLVPGGVAVSARKIGADGKLQASTIVTQPLGVSSVSVTPTSAVSSLVCATFVPQGGGCNFVKLGSDLAQSNPISVKFPDPYKSGSGNLVWARLDSQIDGTIAVFGHYHKFDNQDFYKGINPFLARLSPDISFVWILQLRWPELTSVGMWYPSVSCFPSGDCEIMAASPMDNHTASWRVAADGSLRWRRIEDLRRVPRSRAQYSQGEGVVSVTNYFVDANGNDLIRLFRSDAFGNLSCKESGPCFGQSAVYCDDKNACTNDLCDAQHAGCWHEPFAEGTPCKPGMTCKSGICEL